MVCITKPMVVNNDARHYEGGGHKLYGTLWCHFTNTITKYNDQMVNEGAAYMTSMFWLWLWWHQDNVSKLTIDGATRSVAAFLSRTLPFR